MDGMGCWFFFSQKRLDELKKEARSLRSPVKIGFCLLESDGIKAYTHRNHSGKKPSKYEDAISLGQGRHDHTSSFSRIGKKIPAG
jgi:hypothetical protein